MNNYYIGLILYIVAINMIAFITMGVDKSIAANARKMSRISEKTLFILALILGAPGIYAGMYKFRHKTKHTKFVILIPILILINIITVYYIISYVSNYI